MNKVLKFILKYFVLITAVSLIIHVLFGLTINRQTVFIAVMSGMAFCFGSGAGVVIKAAYRRMKKISWKDTVKKFTDILYKILISRRILTNVLLFILGYLVIFPALFMLVFIIMGKPFNGLTFARALGSSFAIMIAQIIVKLAEAVIKAVKSMIRSKKDNGKGGWNLWIF